MEVDNQVSVPIRMSGLIESTMHHFLGTILWQFIINIDILIGYKD